MVYWPSGLEIIDKIYFWVSFITQEMEEKNVYIEDNEDNDKQKRDLLKR